MDYIPMVGQAHLAVPYLLDDQAEFIPPDQWVTMALDAVAYSTQALYYFRLLKEVFAQEAGIRLGESGWGDWAISKENRKTVNASRSYQVPSLRR
jgi:hypothetical protein